LPSGPPRDALKRDAEAIDLDIREGRFQRWLALVAGLSSGLSGLEVTYEHYKGSYSRRIMYTPLALSAILAASGIAGFYSKRAARTILPAAAALTLADCAVGFYFHIRGIGRKPGGWRFPIVNMVMGPPVFAALRAAPDCRGRRTPIIGPNGSSENTNPSAARRTFAKAAFNGRWPRPRQRQRA